MCEYATLTFLQKLDKIPTPKVQVHGFLLDRGNSLLTPYIFMDKVPSISFYDALGRGMGREEVHETLRQLAQIKKCLIKHPFIEIGSITITEKRLWVRTSNDYTRYGIYSIKTRSTIMSQRALSIKFHYYSSRI